MHGFIDYLFIINYAHVDGEPFDVVVVAEISSGYAFLGHGGFYIFAKDINILKYYVEIIIQINP